VSCVHVVFSLPQELLPLADGNSGCLYRRMVQARAAMLREVAADSRHLGAEIGVLSILHVWGQPLVRQPHARLYRAGGRAHARSQRWIRPTYVASSFR
jgi:hypothetical protein